jgi:hypothetical protein
MERQPQTHRSRNIARAEPFEEEDADYERFSDDLDNEDAALNARLDEAEVWMRLTLRVGI